MTASSYCNENDLQPYDLDAVDQDSQYAPTLGYVGHASASRSGLSPSPRYFSETDTEELSQNVPNRPRLLQSSEMNGGLLSDELPASCIQYTIEWKVRVNKKVISRDTEEDVALTPSAY
jgi:hypothetical protein